MVPCPLAWLSQKYSQCRTSPFLVSLNEPDLNEPASKNPWRADPFLKVQVPEPWQLSLESRAPTQTSPFFNRTFCIQSANLLVVQIFQKELQQLEWLSPLQRLQLHDRVLRGYPPLPGLPLHQKLQLRASLPHRQHLLQAISLLKGSTPKLIEELLVCQQPEIRLLDDINRQSNFKLIFLLVIKLFEEGRAYPMLGHPASLLAVPLNIMNLIQHIISKLPLSLDRLNFHVSNN